jgi:hypothetical protein
MLCLADVLLVATKSGDYYNIYFFKAATLELTHDLQMEWEVKRLVASATGPHHFWAISTSGACLLVELAM